MICVSLAASFFSSACNSLRRAEVNTPAAALFAGTKCTAAAATVFTELVDVDSLAVVTTGTDDDEEEEEEDDDDEDDEDDDDDDDEDDDADDSDDDDTR